MAFDLLGYIITRIEGEVSASAQVETIKQVSIFIAEFGGPHADGWHRKGEPEKIKINQDLS